MSDNKKKVLFFANIPIRTESRSIGGATVLAESILTHLQKDSRVIVTHQQIRKFWRNKLQLLDYFIWLFRFPFLARKFDVISIHGTKDLHFTIAPFLWWWAKLLKKQTVYHFFGGNFMDQYAALPKIFKWLMLKTILRSDTVFFETQQLMSFFEDKNINSAWLPNARKPLDREVKTATFRKKFVFISRIVPSKGIPELLKAAELLPDDYVVDIYGPIDDRHYNLNDFEHLRAKYKGALSPDQIFDTLESYDVLVLPSYFEGEGYPGIIIESLAIGIPVIATHWMALPEVIQDGSNGLLVPIKDAQALAEAIKTFSLDNYPNFSKNALESFRKFNSDIVFDRLIESYLQ